MARATSAALVAIALLSARPVSSQVRASYDIGTLGLVQSLLRLQTTASVMHIGAHPDDEDSALIARLARGDHARVAYLSLNRGEGGQNTIGPELFDPLGVIRTEELLQARRLDGGEQLFTRTFDFGFSKTREESSQLWGDEAVLDDMVRAIRTFRPLVVISRFTGTPADGHGHHQLAGYLTPIAVSRAADPTFFPEQLLEGLHPWQTLKLYVSEGFRPSDAAPVRLETGRVDPVLGRSYYEIAMEGRSLHRSQHQGALELRGERSSGIRLMSSVVNASTEDALFSGIDTSIANLAGLAGAPAGALGIPLAVAEGAAADALSAFTPLDPASIIPRLSSGLEAVRAARRESVGLPVNASMKQELDFRLAGKERDFEDALVRAASVVVDPIADAETVAPGDTLHVGVRTFFPAGVPVQVVDAHVQTPSGWRTEADRAPVMTSGSAGRVAEAPTRAMYFRVVVASDAPPTEPYWLAAPRTGAMYNWPADAPKGAPFGPAILQASVTLTIGSARLTLTRPVEFRTVDSVRGELRRRVDVVPAVSVVMAEPLVIVPVSGRATQREVLVRLEHLTPTATNGVLRLRAPAGWKVVPDEVPFSLGANSERTIERFEVVVPAAVSEAEYQLEAVAMAGDQRFARTLHTIAYPHIQTHRIYEPSVAKVRVMRLAVPTARVGYVTGTGDDVPAAIARMGMSVTLLDAEMLTRGTLSQFDTIVVGIRASETRPDFIANHGRLLDWVRQGGALIVQYQQPDYVDRGLPPFPARVGGRVTEEEAPVVIRHPEQLTFTTPNKITAADWSGWVQERSVNDWTAFDPRYVPLIESHDVGDGPEEGMEVIAKLGRGVYVYTACAWFRQLPAGVPGAYRLFANLLALGRPTAPDRRPGGTAPR